MKKIGLYILLVIGGVAIIDIAYGLVCKHLVGYKSNETISHVWEDSNEDIVIFGASRAHSHYNPQIIEDSLNMSAHNYGMDGCNIYVH